MSSPRDMIAEQAASQIRTGLDGFLVERNRPEPSDLTDRAQYVIQLDGPEDEADQHDSGLFLWPMRMGYEVYVRGGTVAAIMNATLAKMRGALLEDPTLAGMVFGEWHLEGLYPWFDGMKILAVSEWDAFRGVGQSHSGFFSFEVLVTYATTPSDPTTLIRAEEI